MVTNTEKRLLPLSQMARRLRAPVGWLREEATANRLPHLQAGRAILFDAETVENALVEQARQLPSQPADSQEGAKQR